MHFTDSHCHLDFDELSKQLPQLINQCAKANIHQLIVPAIHPENWQKVLDVANSNTTKNTAQNTRQNTKDIKNKKNCKIYPCLGIHPWFLKDLTSHHLSDLANAVERNKNNIIAIGEAGIDGGIVKQQDNLNQQIDFFSYQLTLAKQYQLPIIVHHRQSHQHIIPLLKKANLTTYGVIHAFSGSYQQARDYIDLGFKLGIGGTITYPRAKKTINAIKRLPLSSLVLETDAPAMPLYLKQGQANSPLELVNVFEALIQIRDESAEELAQQIELNIKQLFNL